MGYIMHVEAIVKLSEPCRSSSIVRVVFINHVPRARCMSIGSFNIEL